MKKFLIGALGALGIAGAGAALVVSAGVVDVAADAAHAEAVTRFLAYAREQSIDRRAGAITPPGDLADPERVRRGAGNYDAMCVDCHLAPGKDNSEIRRGLNPQPPDLTRAGEAQSDAARRFWIIKHGIKSTGMPAWSKGGMDDAAIWDLAAFLERLPALTPEAYRQQVAASDGHSHGGMMEAPAAAPAKKHDHHDHSGHPHPPGKGHSHGDHRH